MCREYIVTSYVVHEDLEIALMVLWMFWGLVIFRVTNKKIDINKKSIRVS